MALTASVWKNLCGCKPTGADAHVAALVVVGLDLDLHAVGDEIVSTHLVGT